MTLKTIWKAIEPWIDRDYYLVTTITTIIAISSFHIHFTKDKFDNESDLTIITGKLVDYSFTHGHRGSKMYYLRLDNYRCTFQIDADYLQVFKAELFKIEIKKGDKIDLMISTNKLKDLQTDTKIILLHLKRRNSIYLDKIDTLKIENSNSEIYAGIGFFAAGLLYYIIRRFIWRPKRRWT